MNNTTIIKLFIILKLVLWYPHNIYSTINFLFYKPNNICPFTKLNILYSTKALSCLIFQDYIIAVSLNFILHIFKKEYLTFPNSTKTRCDTAQEILKPIS